MTPEEYRSAVLIDANGSLALFADLVEDWQLRDFTAMDAGWMALAGMPVDNPCQRAWIERPRGHSKTSDIALSVLWALVFAPTKLSGIAAAADKDQGRILIEAIQRLVVANGWGSIISVQESKVINRRTGSILSVISSDAMSSFGLLVDFIVADEVTHWKNRDLWDSLLSTAAKRSRCLLVCIANSGWTDSWQYETREAIQEDPRWHFNSLDGPHASWISHDLLDEQRRLLPGVAFDRLWLNRWSSGSGDALRPETIDESVDPDHAPMSGSEKGFAFSAGLDLGIKRDKSALCVVAKDDSGKLRLAYTRTWTPPPGGEVNLMELEESVRAVSQRYRCPISFDPWQAELLQQRLRSHIAMREVTFAGKNLQAMASAMLEAFNSRNVVLYADEQLINDLRKLRVIEKSYGFRLESPRDGAGHGDLATAFQLALLGAKYMQPARTYSDLPQSGPPLSRDQFLMKFPGRALSRRVF